MTTILDWLMIHWLAAIVCYVLWAVLTGLWFSYLVVEKNGEEKWDIKKDSWLFKFFYGFNICLLSECSEIILPKNTCDLIKGFVMALLFYPCLLLIMLLVFLLTRIILEVMFLFFFGGRVPRSGKPVMDWKKEDYFQLPVRFNPAILFLGSSLFWAWKIWYAAGVKLVAIVNGTIHGVIFATTTFPVNLFSLIVILFTLLMVSISQITKSEKYKIIMETAKGKWCVPFANMLNGKTKDADTANVFARLIVSASSEIDRGLEFEVEVEESA